MVIDDLRKGDFVNRKASMYLLGQKNGERGEKERKKTVCNGSGGSTE